MNTDAVICMALIRQKPSLIPLFRTSSSTVSVMFTKPRRCGTSNHKCSVSDFISPNATGKRFTLQALVFHVSVWHCGRMHLRAICTLALFLLLVETTKAADPPKQKGPTLASVLAASKAGDWRPPDPENTLYLELSAGRVVIELAPIFAPRHVANVKTLARELYFDGLAVLRCQDNYVVQWGDPDAEKPELKRKIQKAQP